MEVSIRRTESAVGTRRLGDTIARATDWLLACQSPEGYWLGELEGDTILESEWLITMAHLRRWDDVKARKAAAYIKSKQLPCGGWSIFPGGPVDVSASVKAYFALKMTREDAGSPRMARAREAIREAGGITAVNSYTRFFLALMSQIPWEAAPAVPPEVMLLPNWFYFNIYEISSWSRTFVVPLSIIWAHKPITRLERSRCIDELFDRGDLERMRPRYNGPVLSWRNFFLGADAGVKAIERWGLVPLRRRAVARAERWIVEHSRKSSGLGAIFPPMIYSLIALRALGYSEDHPEVRRAWDELAKLEIEDEDTLRLQPCTSPVWDTAIALNALAEAGVPPDYPAMQRAAEWIVSKEVRDHGDWQVKRPSLQPGGWYFELENEFYPDIDDSAMVLMALRKCCDVPGRDGSCRRALDWLMGMQGRDGGWASFDVDNNKSIFNNIPFADHNAMLDPSTSDITARMLEMFSYVGMGTDHPQVQRAVKFVREHQEVDGSWFGRWGVNYVYGTWQALRGLDRIGIPRSDPAIKRGADWLRQVQNSDGGWGESCQSYADPGCKGRGPSTPSQTAWALMGLISAGEAGTEATAEGVGYLLRTQTETGTWDEEPFTGTGFPSVFYLRYHLYRHSFPLMALGMYRNAGDTMRSAA